MSIVDDLPPISQPMSRLWRGEVWSNPDSVTQLLTVILPDFSKGVKWPRCKWMPRYEIAQVNVAEGIEAAHNVPIPQILFPSRGDECLCVFDNYKELWVVMWWPY